MKTPEGALIRESISQVCHSPKAGLVRRAADNLAAVTTPPADTADGAGDFEQVIDQAEGPFVYEGDTIIVYRGEAEAVQLVTWMPRFPTPPPFARTALGTWYLRLALPRTARIEYRLSVVRRTTSHRRRREEIGDPFNPPSAIGPFGTNSVLTGPDYQPGWYVSAPPPVNRGVVAEIRVMSHALGGRRHHHVYLPAGHDSHVPHPVVLVHDGSDFARYADLVSILDVLIESGDVAPLVAVMLDPWDRIPEYQANPAHAAHLVEEVLPHLQRRVHLASGPDSVGVIGSSLGGVASLATLWHYREAVGRAGFISGSFAHRTDEEWPGFVFDPVVGFLAAMNGERKLAGCRIYQSVGRYEGLCDFNRRLQPILRAAGAEVHYRETWDGHHWGTWRDRLGEALSYLFPGPAGLPHPN